MLEDKVPLILEVFGGGGLAASQPLYSIYPGVRGDQEDGLCGHVRDMA